jgi:hypothetical protein
MNKSQYMQMQHAWNAFDKSTAMGCATSGRLYNKELCKMLWKQYNEVIEKCGYEPIRHNTPFS